jgi:ATP-dependent helicase HrpA
MVVEAERNDCVSEVLVIAAALSIQDPRERPAERRQAAAESHARFADPDSDFVSLLNLWNYLHERQRSMSGSQFRKLCRTEFLSYPRVREWQDIHAQLRDALGSRSRGQRAPADRDLVHMSLMSGLLSHLGFRDGAGMDYLGARGARFWISPASALFKKPPRWAMAAELVETTRLWAHAAARIRPEWAERVSPHLLKRTHSEASWDADRGFAVAFERVTLYGLPIIASRRVDYGRIDAATAREIFIVHALVRGEWRTRNPALLRNRALVDEARALEGRVRRRDAVVDERWLFEFYDTRIGREVVSGPSFDEWWKAVRAAQPKLLDLVLPAAVDEREYPDVWRQGRLELRLTYQFEPGAEADGVTVHVPLVILNQLDGSGFDWQVPGLRAELVTALVRALPRQMRQGFVSPAERARAFLERADPSMGPLRAVLAHELGVPVDAFREERVPAHLKVTFRIEDGRAVMLGSGKDLDELKRRLSEPMGAAVAAAAHEMERTGLRDWIFGSLPRTLESDGVRGHPAISDEGDSVAIRVFASVADQDRAMLAGARRLILLTVGPKPRALERLLDRDTAVPLGGRVSLDDCVRCATDGLIAENGGAPWDEASFRQLQERVRPALVEEILRVAGAAGVVVTGVAAIEARLGRERFPPPAVADVRSQIAEVVYPGFPARTALRRVADVPRYLRAIERRLDKLRDDPARDAALMGRVQQVQAEYVKARARVEPGELDHVAWMIQELRVSLFAQQLGTAQRVSEERILREIREPRERA